MTIRYHILEESLIAYAAGELDDASSVLVATHLALCPQCRRAARVAEDVGGAMIDDLAPTTMNDNALEGVMSRLGDALTEVDAPLKAEPTCAPILPEPLRSRVGGDVDQIRWRRIAPGLQQVRLDDKQGGPSIRLLKIAGGVGVPEHGHNGDEMTLVLSGGYSDSGHSYARGDVECADQGVVHRPVADTGEDCICLTVTAGKLKFFDIFGRIAQPFVGI